MEGSLIESTESSSRRNRKRKLSASTGEGGVTAVAAATNGNGNGTTNGSETTMSYEVLDFQPASYLNNGNSNLSAGSVSVVEADDANRMETNNKLVHDTDSDDDTDQTASAVWDGPPTTLRAAIAVLWPVRYPTLSSAKKAARRGEAWVNGNKCKGRKTSTQTVQPGDTVGRQQLAPRRAREIAPTDRAPTLLLAYLDPVLAVVVKPAGMSVMSGKKTNEDGVLTMHRLLFHKLPPPDKNAVQPLQRPSPCHRLDKLTAGLLAVARTTPCARDVTQQLESRQVTKRYRAVLHGKLSGESGEVMAALDGRECRSEWKVVERLVYTHANANHSLTLVDLFPHTGRQHQLRRHCRKMGYPIVGDPRYGLERDDARMSAHADATSTTPGEPQPVALMLAAVDLQLSHPSAHYVARTVDPDGSGSWAFAAESSCSFDSETGTLRVQINMPPHMRRLVVEARIAQSVTTTETLPREECVSQC
jgi:23S rRNA-/tRNA-specific pseudouridylate synthase